MMNLYDIYYKEELNSEDLRNTRYDYFISSFNKSERVQFVYEKVGANKKIWIYFKEYNFESSEIDLALGHKCEEDTESEQIKVFIEKALGQQLNKLKYLSLCFDITGFMRPQLLFLLKYLKSMGVASFDVIYTEPALYSEKEKTKFSIGNIIEIRQVHGFEGSHNHNTNNDLLIVGSGYDEKLISSIADEKEHAKKLQLIGFPSLLPDMYQQNILKASLANESLGSSSLMKPIFAPANDPFKTASAISKAVAEYERTNGCVSNLYLSPLSTKAQALGFGLYYLYEREGTNTSMIFPFVENYQKETSKGYSKIIKYTVEF